jgi:hypothetical protein
VRPYDARPWLVWLLCLAAGGYLLYETYELGARTGPAKLLVLPVRTEAVRLLPDSLLCAQWQTILWYDSLRIVETDLP